MLHVQSLRAGIALFALTTLSLLGPSRAQASMITVTATANSGAGSLRDALASASDGDTIVFDASLVGMLINLVTPDPRTLGLPPMIPLGPTALVVDHIHVTIDGSAAPGLQIDGASTWRVFLVINGGQLDLRNVTVQNGHALGGDGGNPGGGGAAGLGGGAFVANGSTLTLDGVTMLQNIATGGAGGDTSRVFGRGCAGGGGGINAPPECRGGDGLSLAGAGGAPNGGSSIVAPAGQNGGPGGGGSGGCSDGFNAYAGGLGGWGGGGALGPLWRPRGGTVDAAEQTEWRAPDQLLLCARQLRLAFGARVDHEWSRAADAFGGYVVVGDHNTARETPCACANDRHPWRSPPYSGEWQGR